MPYTSRLIAIKQEKKISNAEISRLSDVPLATVTRIFNEQTLTPSFETFVKIAVALGASLDEIAGIKQPETPPVDAHIENTLINYSQLLQEKDDRIRELKEERDQEHRERVRMLMFTCGLIAVGVAILIFDMFNGHIGYFTY